MSGPNMLTRSLTTANQETSNSNSYQVLFDSIPQSGLKSDILFSTVKNRIPEEREYVQRLRVVFRFNITKGNELAAIWTCDTRTSLDGDVYRNVPKPGIKVDCTVTVDDDDLIKIMVGKLNPQRAFMMSKLKIKGNIILLQKLYVIWLKMRREGKIPELDLIQAMLDDSLIPGIKSEFMAIEIVQRVVKMPYLLEKVNATIQVNVTKQGQVMVRYLLGMHSKEKPQFKRLNCVSTLAKNSTNNTAEHDSPEIRKETTAIGDWITKPDIIFTIEDDDLVLIIYGIRKARTMVDQGSLHIEGNLDLAERAILIFEQPPIMARL